MQKNWAWFTEFRGGAQNSCNPVFIEVGLRLGVDRYYKYFRQFGLLDKTGIDLPGEAGTIMHQKKIWRSRTGNRLFRTVISDHAGPACDNGKFSDQWRQAHNSTFRGGSLNPDGTEGKKLEFPVKEGIVSEETSKK